MRRRWLGAVAALGLLLGGAGSSKAFFFIAVPIGLGNPVFGGGLGGWGWGGWGGWRGWGYYPGGIGFNYYPLAYGFPNYGMGYSGWGWAANPYYYDTFRTTSASTGISYVAYAGPGTSKELVAAAYAAPTLDCDACGAHGYCIAITLSAPPPYSAPDQPATVEVHVPADAEVWFDGVKASQTGSERTFQTPSLEKGSSYHYEVRARWTLDGRAVERTQRVDVYSGGQVSVRFPPAR